MENPQLEERSIIIVPHTHWDREWYESFQSFRYKLVALIDELLDIMEEQDYYFMLDGQTIVLEDYFEIRPENRERVLNLIRKGNIGIGPWYLLPDEWLVGEENMVRNLERGYQMAKEMNFPLMRVAYLPDQFGHSQIIPQFLADITDIRAAALWRGVPPEVNTVPFTWKRHKDSASSILGVYLANSYSNAAHLSDDLNELQDAIKATVEELEPFSPLPNYLLMNGTDHQFPTPAIQNMLSEIDLPGKIRVGLLNHYVDILQEDIKKAGYTPPDHIGEFRSSVKAPLLQDTYSARMWIKQWNQKCEDLLVNYAEPVSTYLAFYNKKKYPASFLDVSWKWLLKNAPHDSICGCSIDQVHDEMKSRFSWSESIAQKVMDEHMIALRDDGKEVDSRHVYAFNHTNSGLPQLLEFKLPSDIAVVGLKAGDGTEYTVKPTSSSEEIMLDELMGPTVLKTGIRMLPGRKFEGVWINEVNIFDSADPTICEIRLSLADKAIGDLNVKDLKQQVLDLVNSKKYKKFHVIASMGEEQGYMALIPLKPWGFSSFEVISTMEKPEEPEFSISKKMVSNKFYELTFNGDGSFSLLDKMNNTSYEKLHVLEDTGDRGDLYTFGKVEPTVYKTGKVKRKVISKGALFNEIEQKLVFSTYRELKHNDRGKRVGKVKIPVRTVFRFYHDLPRIDIETTLTNHAKDHRLRVGFNLPFACNETITSTHFGVVRRDAQPSRNGEFIERPSGIQAQKRFIRVEGENAGLTLINKGLPEVELDNNILSLTLLRSVGDLSRSDFDERPIHAGPVYATPGGQELDVKYTFQYSILSHARDADITYSADHSELFSVQATTVTKTSISEDILENIFQLDNPLIRVSSFRMINDAMVLTLYNISAEPVNCELGLHPKITDCASVIIGGEVKEEHKVENNKIELGFDPMEIKMLKMN